MARTTITAQVIEADAGEAPSYTTIDATLVSNGLEVTDAFEAAGRLLIHVKNTNAGAKNLTVQSSDGGSYPLDDFAGVGDLVVAVPATTGERLVTLGDIARYTQAGQSLYLDFESGMTGQVAVYRIPVA